MGLSMPLRFRPPKQLSTTLETPALEGLVMHETLYGSLARRVFMRNLLVAALLAILAYQGVCLSFYASKTVYVPYVLLVRDDGSYHVLTPPDPTWSPDDALARNDIERFIYATRSVLMDPPENTRRWEAVLKCATAQGQRDAEAAYWRLKDELKTFRGKIQVEIKTILTRAALHTYEVLWTETRFDENNDRVPAAYGGFTMWRGVFTVKFDRMAANPNTCPDGVLYDSGVISEEH
jgi:type IV secretory pathway TrbF-like protein